MMKLVASEAQEQIALMNWASVATLHVGKRTRKPIAEFLMHIPNQGKRSLWGGKQLVSMGLKAGVPDLFLAYPKWERYFPAPIHDKILCPGMFIEMKRRNLKTAKNGGLSADQKRMLSLLDSVGYRCIVAYGWEEARDAILEYLI
jgi:hypothetical protein